MKPNYYEILDHAGFLEDGKNFIFYYYAIKDDSVYSHHEDIAKAKYFRFYKNDIETDGVYELEPIEGIITARELVSKKQLDEILTERGCNDGLERFADFYYVLKVEMSNYCARVKCKTVDLNRVNGNDTFSPHSPKVVSEECLKGIRA